MKKLMLSLLIASTLGGYLLAFPMGSGQGFGGKGQMQLIGREGVANPFFDEYFWMHPNFPDPAVRDLLKKYRDKMEDIYFESRKERRALHDTRMELYLKLKDLSKRYNTDKSLKKQIIEVTKQIYDVTEKIQTLNKKTMEKLQQLNEERKKEFSEFSKKWLGEIEKDETKLSNFVEWINQREEYREFRKRR